MGLGVLLCIVASSSTADVGGGRGIPATPWRISGPRDANELEKAKKAAAKCQALSLPGKLFEKSRDGMATLEDVSLQPKPLRQGEPGAYELRGKSVPGGKSIVVLFSQLESFVVMAKTDDSIKLAVTVWPDIASGDLIDKQPSYKEIMDGYRREIVIEMNIHSSDGRELEFAGHYETALPLTNLAIGTKGDFYGGDPRAVNPRRFWWAIPSVTKDPNYPYRLMPKA